MDTVIFLNPELLLRQNRIKTELSSNFRIIKNLQSRSRRLEIKRL